MSRETFTIAYDGPALRNGAMDVRDLAPALLGLGQLMDAANTTLNGDVAQLQVQCGPPNGSRRAGSQHPA